MTNTLAILRKELNIYFTTVVAYAGFGSFAFLMGLLFVGSLNRYQNLTASYLQAQQPEMIARLNFNDMIISPMLSTGIWLFLFFVPFLTMRLFAEEKSSRTFELLMSAPIRSAELVIGKFLAVALLMGALTSISLLYPLILSMYGSGAGGWGGVEWTPVWSGTFSVYLLGLTFCPGILPIAPVVQIDAIGGHFFGLLFEPLLGLCDDLLLGIEGELPG